MAKATWNGVVVAESGDTVVVDGNHYFPHEAIKKEYFKPSAQSSVCPWKGTASYYSLQVGGEMNEDAAWFYPDPKPDAENIRNRVAFWRGVVVE